MAENEEMPMRSQTSTRPHPGEILSEEFMMPPQRTAYRVAKDLHVPAPRLHDIVRGKRSITADTAVRLGIYFSLPAQFWLNLQNDYDLRQARCSVGIAKVQPRKAALSGDLLFPDP